MIKIIFAGNKFNLITNFIYIRYNNELSIYTTNK